MLELKEISFSFTGRKRDKAKAGRPDRPETLKRVNLEVQRGETVVLVGQSGSGKSTLCRVALALLAPDHGFVSFEGQDLSQMSGKEMSAFRRRVGFMVQDSTSALNPRRRILGSVAAQLAETGADAAERHERASEALNRVGLNTDLGERLPNEVSGGQRQRVALARAIVGNPDLLIFDEPLSGLDLLTEANMVELIREMSANSSCLFVTHDLFLARTLGDRLAVMKQGEIVETGPVDQVLRNPVHPHTIELIRALPPAEPSSVWRKQHGIKRPDQPPLVAGL